MLWKSMIQRCHNPRNPSYPSYGGRGVHVCDRWRSSYAAFCADVGPRPAGLTLDRIDGARGYEPGNVRWATKREQALNRSTTKLITYRGRTLSIADWARRAGLSSQTLHSRLTLGWPMRRALTAAVDRRFQRPNLSRNEQPCT